MNLNQKILIISDLCVNSLSLSISSNEECLDQVDSFEQAMNEQTSQPGDKDYKNIQLEKDIMKYLMELKIQMWTDPYSKEEEFWNSKKQKQQSLQINHRSNLFNGNSILQRRLALRHSMQNSQNWYSSQQMNEVSNQ